jgi:hypothetical protein
MHDVNSRDTAEPREIESHDIRYMVGVCAKPFEAVPQHMMWNSAIPMRSVQLNILTHLDIVPPAHEKGPENRRTMESRGATPYSTRRA